MIFNGKAGPKTYNGPFHLNSVLSGEPYDILNSIMALFESLGIDYKSVKIPFFFSFSIKFLKKERKIQIFLQ